MTAELGISLVRVGDRRREDYGDITGLAKSIDRYGLLHPIVVDADDNLVAGGRRLEAVKKLGWPSIPIRRLGELSETELREIELEENLRRKDLTEIERSRDMLVLVEATSDTIDVSSHGETKGRPSEPGSLRRVAERIGVSKDTIRRAKEHVAAVDEFPDLEPLPQKTAIKTARERRRPMLPPQSQEERDRQHRWTTTKNVLDGLRTFDRDLIPERIRETAERIDNSTVRPVEGKVTVEGLRRAAAWCSALADELERVQSTQGVAA